MGILESLKFVQGSIAKKDFLPAMTHFVIENKTVRGYNGRLALCCPIEFDIDCKPKADELVNAIQQCDETIVLSMTETGRLRIVSGDYKGFAKCVTEETPHVLPDGARVEFPGEEMLKALKAVEPFIGVDASRPWSTGVLLRGQSAIATNNVCIAEYWVGADFPRAVNLPHTAVKEMLRIGEVPTHAQLGDNSATFHYKGDKWMRTQLLATEWPDIERILNEPSNQKPVDPRLFVGLQKISKRANDMHQVFIRGDLLSTVAQDIEEGAQYRVPGLGVEAIFSISMLEMLSGIAETIDFTSYPKPCLFYGGRIRGAIIGMRQS